MKFSLRSQCCWLKIEIIFPLNKPDIFYARYWGTWQRRGWYYSCQDSQFSCGDKPVPKWPGDMPAAEKGWTEGSEGSEKGVERDEKVPQGWDILRGGGSSGRGNSMGLESKLETTGHVWQQVVKLATLSAVGRKMPPPEISTSQPPEPETMSHYVAKGN